MGDEQRRPSRKSVLLYETWSPHSGRIRVMERGRERRLIVRGEIQSVYFPDGDWGAAQRDYWGQALSRLERRRRPHVLLVGLGGGTQIHLLQQLANPRLITIIERDPTIIQIARRWFDLDAAGALELLCADARDALAHLGRSRRRFDFVMDDISYAGPAANAVTTVRQLAPLVAPGGRLVVNQHERPSARAVATALQDTLSSVTVRRVRPEMVNLLVCGSRPRGRRAEDRARGQSRLSFL